MIDDHLLKKNAQIIPVGRALLWIILSIILVTGSAVLGVFYFQHMRAKKIHDEKFRIVAIVQTAGQREILKPVYLAELLNLSIDKPANLFQFNSLEGRSKLLQSPLIKDASVKKISPGTVYIDYIMRQPIAYLFDYDNTGIDKEGYIFPFKPFFTPKKLPEIYLGLAEDNLEYETEKDITRRWGINLKDKKTDLAFRVLEIVTACCNKNSFVKRIDVSKAFAQSYGQKEIVVVIEDPIEEKIDNRLTLFYLTRILRLSPERYQKELITYKKIRNFLDKNVTLNEKVIVRANSNVIELRIPQLAFMTQ